MGVRVRIGVIIGNKLFEAVGLVNSGFETDKPQLLVPYKFLSVNNINLDALGRPTITEYDTAGGPVTLYSFIEACKVSVIEEDIKSRDVNSDLVVSPIEKEILLSDSLTEELGIVILSPRKGIWKFSNDPLDKVRYSYKPQYW